MDSKWVLCLVLFWCISDVHSQYSKIFTVTNYGAIADGKTDNSQAFLNAWSKACQTNGGLLAVPKGTYFVKGVNFKGPCNGQTFFRHKGTLIASSGTSFEGDYWISFSHVDGLTLFGNGIFDGNGPSAWPHNKCGKSSNCNPLPTSIKFTHVRDSVVRDIHSVNSKMFHLLMDQCENIAVRDVHISAPKDSPNTDGIHIGNSNKVKISNCYIATGDDCISMGAGTTNINISSIWCGPGHGISIGSLGKYKGEKDVSGISVRNCTFTNTSNGLRIKTWARFSIPTTVSDVTFADVRVNNVKNPIIIDQFYCPHSLCSHQGESAVQIKGVKFIDIKGSTSSKVAVAVQCSKSKPCQNIQFSGLDLTLSGTRQPAVASCSNANDKFLGNNQVPSHCS